MHLIVVISRNALNSGQGVARSGGVALGVNLSVLDELPGGSEVDAAGR